MKYGFGVKIIANQNLPYLSYEFLDIHGEEISMKHSNDMK